MEQILAKLEGVVEDHLEQQAEDDNYKSKAGELVMELQQTLQEEVNLRKRADEINGMIDNLRDTLLKHKNINFSDLFKRYLADMNERPENFEGVNFYQGPVLAGAPRRRPEPVAERAANVARGIQQLYGAPAMVQEVLEDIQAARNPVRWDEVQMVNPQPEEPVAENNGPWYQDRDGVEFHIDHVVGVIDGRKIPSAVVRIAILQHRSTLRAMGWRAE